jgi:hypothetical protein
LLPHQSLNSVGSTGALECRERPWRISLILHFAPCFSMICPYYQLVSQVFLRQTNK